MTSSEYRYQIGEFKMNKPFIEYMLKYTKENKDKQDLIWQEYQRSAVHRNAR